MGEYCKVEKSDHVLTVTLNRPERLNALHPPANAELGEVFDDYAADPDMWVAIITGEGRGFSAGNDLRYQAEGGERMATPRGFGGLSSRFDLTKPVIAAVNGVAMVEGSKSLFPATSSWRPRLPGSPCPSPRSGLPRWPVAFSGFPGLSVRSGRWA